MTANIKFHKHFLRLHRREIRRIQELIIQEREKRERDEIERKLKQLATQKGDTARDLCSL